MTNQEAIKILEQRDVHGVPCGNSGGISEAVDLAIKALEREPCEDAVSREEVLMCLTGEFTADDDKVGEYIGKFAKRIKALPSVNVGKDINVTTTEDAVSRKYLLDMYKHHLESGWHLTGEQVLEDIKNAPSVQPQTVDWNEMIEEIKEETVAMLAAEENDYWDVKYGLFEEDILAIINKYRNGERNE